MFYVPKRPPSDFRLGKAMPRQPAVLSVVTPFGLSVVHANNVVGIMSRLAQETQARNLAKCSKLQRLRVVIVVFRKKELEGKLLTVIVVDCYNRTTAREQKESSE